MLRRQSRRHRQLPKRGMTAQSAKEPPLVQSSQIILAHRESRWTLSADGHGHNSIIDDARFLRFQLANTTKVPTISDTNLPRRYCLLCNLMIRLSKEMASTSQSIVIGTAADTSLFIMTSMQGACEAIPSYSSPIERPQGLAPPSTRCYVHL